jgi:sialic acid synthase SpsE
MRKLADVILNPRKVEGAIERPYLIAEAGVNHEGSLDTAYHLIEQAKEGGADAIKFQTYRASSLAAKDSPAYWDQSKESTTSQYQLFKKYDGFWKPEFEKLKERCDANDIEFLSTPFDIHAAEFLNDLMEVFKISSSDITNKPFVEHICSFSKPILLSTGASSCIEVREAVAWVKTLNIPLSIMHCVLNYPTNDANANLNMIKGLKAEYPDLTVGYSDHTMPGEMGNLMIATMMGAQILEKHFTHDKNLPGNDHYHAMDRDDLALFSRNLAESLQVLGGADKIVLDSEEIARQHARRSLVAAVGIPVGTKINSEHLTWKRPGAGISPREIDDVIGRYAVRDIAEDELIAWEHLEKLQ